ncbi:head maturation protease, ClpP-related [Halomonas citrativorans]|uniref:ATP-dependent Clp protease proteolytic subunit n=1 Tax=Halomonas citrativorans TaxID=2742612 RepID=A0ABR9F9B7_9GAMM|nr:head maturation protease, ClpP-related [Halomonas citrativorans]MBE0403073.1 Clp protease ClpP [Halomonas citrativorans]
MKWFTAKAKASNPKAAHITIDGEIGRDWWDDSGISSKAFMSAVKALGDIDEIVLDINSEGGGVFDGITIANYLRAHPAKVVVNVLGQASSIASVIAAAGDEVNMGLGSWMMVHQPWTVALGNADELRALAGDLDKITDGLMANYLARVGEDKREAMLALLKGENGKDGTLLTAEEAVEFGLADRVLVETKAAASMASLARAMAHGAEQARAKLQQFKPPKAMTAADALALAFDVTPEEAEAQAADLGDQIIALKQGGAITVVAKIEDIPPPLLDEIKAMGAGKIQIDNSVQEAVAAERTRITSIVKACQTTGQSQLMEKLIDNGMAEAQASEYIYDVAAASGNKSSIHSSHSPEGGHRAAIDHNKIYARINRKAQA